MRHFYSCYNASCCRTETFLDFKGNSSSYPFNSGNFKHSSLDFIIDQDNQLWERSDSISSYRLQTDLFFEWDTPQEQIPSSHYYWPSPYNYSGILIPRSGYWKWVENNDSFGLLLDYGYGELYGIGNYEESINKASGADFYPRLLLNSPIVDILRTDPSFKRVYTKPISGYDISIKKNYEDDPGFGFEVQPNEEFGLYLGISIPDILATGTGYVKHNKDDTQYLANVIKLEKPVVLGSKKDYGITNITPIEFSGTAVADQKVYISINNYSITDIVDVDSSGIWRYTTPSLADSLHVFSFTTIDRLYNTSETTLHHVTVDTKAPEVPIITNVFDSQSLAIGSVNKNKYTNDTIIDFEGSAESYSSVRVVGPGVNTFVDVSSIGKWNYRTNSLSNGLKSFAFSCKDGAGNEGSSELFDFYVKITAPGPPIISSVVDRLNNNILINTYTNEVMPTFSITSSENRMMVVTKDKSVLLRGTNVQYIPDALSDGLNTFYFYSIDDATNYSTPTVFYFYVDTKPPNQPEILRIVDETNDKRVKFFAKNSSLKVFGLAEPNSKVSVKINGDDPIIANVSGDGSWNKTISLDEGLNNIIFKNVDLADNSGTPVSASVYVIESPESVVVESQNTTSYKNPIIFGSGPANGIIRIETTGNKILYNGNIGYDGQWSYFGNTLSSGSYSFDIHATDPAGNVVSEQFFLSVSSGIPTNSPSSIKAIDNVKLKRRVLENSDSTNDSRPIFYGECAYGLRIKVSGDLSGVDYTSISSNNTWQYQSKFLPSGTNVLNFYAIDSSGTVLGQNSFTTIVDHSDPSAPIINSVTDENSNEITNNGWSTTQNVTFSLTTDSNTSLRVKINDIDIDYEEGGSSSYSVRLLENKNMISFSSINEAGSEGSSTHYIINVDSSVPEPPILINVIDNIYPNGGSVKPGGYTNDTMPTFVGLAEPGIIIKIVSDDTYFVDVKLTGEWSFTPLPLSDGNHTFTFYAVDRAGNESAPITFSFNVLTTLPASPTIISIVDDQSRLTDPLSDGDTTNDPTPTFTILTVGAESFDIYINNVWVNNLGGGGGVVYEPPFLPNGEHLFSFVAIDAAGNRSAPTNISLIISVDFPEPPTIYSVKDNINSLSIIEELIHPARTNDPNPVFEGTAPFNTNVEVYSSNTLLETRPVNSNGYWSFSPTLASTTHYLSFLSVDFAGNKSKPLYFTLTVDTSPPLPPVITKVTSQKGPMPVFFGTKESNSYISIYKNDIYQNQLSPSIDTNWKYTSPPLSTGNYNFKFTATDLAGNESAPASYDILCELSDLNPIPDYYLAVKPTGNDPSLVIEPVELSTRFEYRVQEILVIDSGEGYTNCNLVFPNDERGRCAKVNIILSNESISSISVIDSGIYSEIPEPFIAGDGSSAHLGVIWVAEPVKVLRVNNGSHLVPEAEYLLKNRNNPEDSGTLIETFNLARRIRDFTIINSGTGYTTDYGKDLELEVKINPGNLEFPGQSIEVVESFRAVLGSGSVYNVDTIRDFWNNPLTSGNFLYRTSGNAYAPELDFVYKIFSGTEDLELDAYYSDNNTRVNFLITNPGDKYTSAPMVRASTTWVEPKLIQTEIPILWDKVFITGVNGIIGKSNDGSIYEWKSDKPEEEKKPVFLSGYIPGNNFFSNEDTENDYKLRCSGITISFGGLAEETIFADDLWVVDRRAYIIVDNDLYSLTSFGKEYIDIPPPRESITYTGIGSGTITTYYDWSVAECRITGTTVVDDRPRIPYVHRWFETNLFFKIQNGGTNYSGLIDKDIFFMVPEEPMTRFFSTDLPDEYIYADRQCADSGFTVYTVDQRIMTTEADFVPLEFKDNNTYDSFGIGFLLNASYETDENGAITYLYAESINAFGTDSSSSFPLNQNPRNKSIWTFQEHPADITWKLMQGTDGRGATVTLEAVGTIDKEYILLPSGYTGQRIYKYSKHILSQDFALRIPEKKVNGPLFIDSKDILRPTDLGCIKPECKAELDLNFYLDGQTFDTLWNDVSYFLAKAEREDSEITTDFGPSSTLDFDIYNNMIISSGNLPKSGFNNLNMAGIPFLKPNPDPSLVTSEAFISGCLESICVEKGGFGFSTPPDVFINGLVDGGHQATASAVIEGSISINIVDGGLDYISEPTLVFDGPGVPPIVNQIILDNSGTIKRVSLRDGGRYRSPPTISLINEVFGSGNARSATLEPALSGSVKFIAITDSGSMYQYPPDILIANTDDESYIKLMNGTITRKEYDELPHTAVAQTKISGSLDRIKNEGDLTDKECDNHRTIDPSGCVITFTNLGAYAISGTYPENTYNIPDTIDKQYPLLGYTYEYPGYVETPFYTAPQASIALDRSLIIYPSKLKNLRATGYFLSPYFMSLRENPYPEGSFSTFGFGGIYYKALKYKNKNLQDQIFTNINLHKLENLRFGFDSDDDYFWRYNGKLFRTYCYDKINNPFYTYNRTGCSSTGKLFYLHDIRWSGTPEFEIFDTTGSGMLFTTTLDGESKISSIVVSNTGNGLYTEYATIALKSGAILFEEADVETVIDTARYSGVKNIIINDPGYGYYPNDTKIDINHNTGSGLELKIYYYDTAIPTGIAAISIVNGGSNYSSPPIVTLINASSGYQNKIIQDINISLRSRVDPVYGYYLGDLGYYTIGNIMEYEFSSIEYINNNNYIKYIGNEKIPLNYTSNSDLYEYAYRHDGLVDVDIISESYSKIPTTDPINPEIIVRSSILGVPLCSPPATIGYDINAMIFLSELVAYHERNNTLIRINIPDVKNPNSINPITTDIKKSLLY